MLELKQAQTNNTLDECRPVQYSYITTTIGLFRSEGFLGSSMACITCIVSISAINCSSLHVDNADLNTSAVVLDSVVNVTCRPGFELDDNNVWVVVQCRADSTWTPTPPNCIGNFSKVFTVD